MATTADLPVIECPSCFNEFQWDDYYDIHVGHERECPHCKCTVIVTTVDTVVRASFEVKGFERSAAGKFR
jgi:hypothetical protein